jgi:hypothetical protein
MIRTYTVRAFLIAAVAAALLVAGGPVAAQQSPPAATDAISLVDAIDGGLVRAEFTGTGSASGAAVLLRIARTSPDELTIFVPAGLLLVNADDDEQDMVVRRLLGTSIGGARYQPATLIELRDDDEHVYVLEAYCLEAHRDNPSRGTGLTPAGFAHPDVVAVLEAVDRVSDAVDDISVIQAAVWAITDNISADELNEIGYGLSDREAQLVADVLAAAGFDPAGFRLFGG